jgi:PTS system cellobiose-specific IIB component
MAICCGGGFSSSTMAEHLNKQIREKHLEDKIFLEFIPFANLYGDDSAFITSVKRERQDEVDVALLCPHLEYDAKRAVAARKLHIPIFILPMRLYGIVDIENLIEDAEDVLELWKKGAPALVTFPDEPRSVVAKRTVSHRRWLASQKK